MYIFNGNFEIVDASNYYIVMYGILDGVRDYGLFCLKSLFINFTQIEKLITEQKNHRISSEYMYTYIFIHTHIYSKYTHILYHFNSENPRQKIFPAPHPQFDGCIERN